MSRENDSSHVPPCHSHGSLTHADAHDVTYSALKDGLRAFAKNDPLDSLAAVVLGGAYLFYLAEKGKNPKVRTFYDALLFISTCLSVGYADVFAQTNAGKAIASFVMTFGPSLSARALDAPEKTSAPPAVG